MTTRGARATRLVALAAVLLASPLAVPRGEASATAGQPDRCGERAVTAEFLDESFDDGIDGLVGADYQRAIELDDGRVLWVFQDAFVEGANGSVDFSHNAAVLQDGTCFELLGGDGGSPWVALPGDAAFGRWLWPLDGYQLDDGTVRIHLAEMEERGDRYLGNTTPVATWVVDLDLETMTLGEPEPAPDSSEALYGFSVTEDDTHRYLYAQCHRQFGFTAFGHDPCATDVFVGRQPLDAPDAALEYWDGEGWSDDPESAVSVVPARDPDAPSGHAEPMQVERLDDQWIAVTKVDDWYGSTMRLDVADRPEGPWTTTAELPVATIDEDVSAYFASIVPSDDDGVTVAMGNNRWDGAFSSSYRPVVATIPDWLWTDQP